MGSRNKNGKKDSRPAAYHHGDLRSTLIASAVKHLESKPVESISLRELARGAGVSLAAPYRHFKDKEALLAAISQEGFDLKRKYMEQAIKQSKGDVQKMFFGCGNAYFKMGMLHPQHFKLMVASNVCPSEKYPELMETAARTFALLTQVMKKCQEAGLIGSGDPFHHALNCWAVVNGFTSLYAEGRLEWVGVTQQNAEAALKTLLSQYLLGSAQPLSKSDSGFRPFMSPKSAPRKQALLSFMTLMP